MFFIYLFVLLIYTNTLFANDSFEKQSFVVATAIVDDDSAHFFFKGRSRPVTIYTHICTNVQFRVAIQCEQTTQTVDSSQLQ